MIKTSEIVFSPQEFFKIWLKAYTKQFILVFVVMFLFACAAVFSIYGKETVLRNALLSFTGMASYSTFVIILMVLKGWFFYRSPKNKYLFIPYTIEFDDEGMKVTKKDGTDTSILWADISKITKYEHFYNVWVNKLSATYLPIASFDEKSLSEFEKLLAEKKIPFKK